MDKDIAKLKTIIKYCDKTAELIEEYGDDIEDFVDNMAFQERCSFYVLQIGENAGKLSKELTKKFPETDWDGIRILRNEIAHAYNWMDAELIWSAVTDDLPKIKKACEIILCELENP